MKPIKILLTTITFSAATYAGFSPNLFPQNLYYKTFQGECLRGCASSGVQYCTWTLWGYTSLTDCVLEINPVPAFEPF